MSIRRKEHDNLRRPKGEDVVVPVPSLSYVKMTTEVTFQYTLLRKKEKLVVPVTLYGLTRNKNYKQTEVNASNSNFMYLTREHHADHHAPMPSVVKSKAAAAAAVKPTAAGALFFASLGL